MIEAPETDDMTTETRTGQDRTPKEIGSRIINAIGPATGVLLILGAAWMFYHEATSPALRLESNARGIELQRPLDVPLTTRSLWTVQLLFRAGPPHHINPLYGYRVEDIEGLLIRPEVVEPAAVIQRCWPTDRDRSERQNPTEWTGTGWCALYTDSIKTAHNKARQQTGDTIAYVGTTYPIRGATPADTFLSRHTPPDPHRR